MPYIKIENRQTFDGAYRLGTEAVGPGELNYILTQIIRGYLINTGIRYATLNDIVGALECCKLEFIRRVVSPYEDEKIKENSDVYIVEI